MAADTGLNDLRERRPASSSSPQTNNTGTKYRSSSNSIRRRVKSKPWLPHKSVWWNSSQHRQKNARHWITRLVLLVLFMRCVLIVLNWRHSSDPNNHTAIIVENNISPGGYVSIRMMGYERRPRTLTLNDNKKMLTVSDKKAEKIIAPSPRKRGRGMAFEKAIEIYGGGSDESISKEKQLDAKFALLQFEDGDCVAMQSWQMKSFPSCNFVHEVDLNGKSEKLINGGHFRDVWSFNNWDGKEMVLKTLVYAKDFDVRNDDRHRRDAVAMDQLSKSKHVPNIYGYCSNSGIFDLSEGDDLAHLLYSIRKGEQSIDKIERLRIASQVANAIADAHHYNSKGHPMIAHTDIAAKQFILMDGIYQLNDFNRCRFLRWDKKRHRTCGFQIASSPGKNRSPEEYSGKHTVLTEKVDIYSMGNIFFSLLTDEIAFDKVELKQARSSVQHGSRPLIKSEVKNSKDKVDLALMHAMNMCYIQDPEKRPSAKDVASYLATELQKIESEV